MNENKPKIRIEFHDGTFKEYLVKDISMIWKIIPKTTY